MYHYFICHQQRDNQLNCDTMLSYLINFKMHLAFWNVKMFLKMHIVSSMKYCILSLNTQQLIRSLNSELTVFPGKALDTPGPHCYHFILRGEIFKETVSLGVYSPWLRENWFLVHSLFLDDKSGKIKTFCEDHWSMWLFRKEETHSIIQWRGTCMLKYQAALSTLVYSLVTATKLHGLICALLEGAALWSHYLITSLCVLLLESLCVNTATLGNSQKSSAFEPSREANQDRSAGRRREGFRREICLL